jgi:hypothetical protein
MYNNRYYVNWYVPMRIQKDFSQSEEDCIERAVEDFNDYFQTATSEMVSNKKYITSARVSHNRVVIRFETEKPLIYTRRGNALRQFSRFLSEEGFDRYVANHRLMRA